MENTEARGLRSLGLVAQGMPSLGLGALAPTFSELVYNPQSVVLTVLPAFTADFDEDGDVDSDDLIVWQGAYSTNALADADGDGDSDGHDFLRWQREYPGLGPLAGSVAVPEPSSLFLISFLIVVQRRAV